MSLHRESIGNVVLDAALLAGRYALCARRSGRYLSVAGDVAFDVLPYLQDSIGKTLWVADEAALAAVKAVPLCRS
ncbi:MAG: hypothetical protein R3E61_01275 [Pseudomonadales bacterium]